jgi:cyclopropane fatty-acyl-phospholipid synthase-like methyltransferase
MCAGPPSTKALLTPKKSVTFDNTNDGVKQYLSTLMTYVHQVFARPKACYIEQYLYNQKARKISKIAKKARLNNTAKHTVDEILKTGKGGSALPKALEENICK